jgi:hypothetical protein
MGHAGCLSRVDPDQYDDDDEYEYDLDLRRFADIHFAVQFDDKPFWETI